MEDAYRYAYLRGALKFWIGQGTPVDPANLLRILEDAESQYR